MKADYLNIAAIASLAHGKEGKDEFTFPEVLEVIRQCSLNEIAVLGVEIERVSAEGYYTEGLSTYDLKMTALEKVLQKSGWVDYVRTNNARAEEFIGQNPTGDDHVQLPRGTNTARART